MAINRRRRGLTLRVLLSFVVTLSLLFGGCFKEEQGEQFYGRVIVPGAQEFRWSDGGLPRVFDPARAAAPPDTDAVRALFEGLTDYEPATLRPVPAVASRWESSEGGRRWTFHLRANARWSNGDPVTAQDFLRSWRRTLRLGELAPHSKLLSNIEGAQGLSAVSPTQQSGTSDVGEARSNSRDKAETESVPQTVQSPNAPPAFGVVAPDAHTLRVTLMRPDNNFPALVAHPVFRPVHELSPGVDLSEFREEQGKGANAEPGIVTNGAFNLARLAGDRVELERAASYWDARSVQLERVSFIDRGDPEAALAAYRAGELDAVTNAPVAPVAVKLLTPYKDFRRETFGALNYYGFNTARPPFDDRRVREALAVALDLERLSADTLGGSTEPAKKFLPPKGDAGESLSVDESVAESSVKNKREQAVAKTADGDGAGDVKEIEHNVEHARKLLTEAGYPGGENFPRVRLLVNRNEQQRVVAQAVARMWREALGIETEIVVRPWEEYEAMLRAGDYDVVRRSLVMQTTDEETNMIQLFGDTRGAQAAGETSGIDSQNDSPDASNDESVAARNQTGVRRVSPVLTESQALSELPAIPLHFATSYALVKPYVEGFESNLLDAPSLKNVRINSGWRAPSEIAPSRLARVARR
ncbi:MAG TPA: peptide ABC transporter substrate-binding protein [Pyrinomonadaceae bacterium]|nr:peptide ABC transporter substrate-binding protein [Pyrinomonadaceae bacterium]